MSYDIGMVGLGVMGRNLLLNLADHGFAVMGLDNDLSKVKALKQEGTGKKVDATTQREVFLRELRLPRAIILLVPAGKIVDNVLSDLASHLAPGDLVVDAGNSFFKDTDRRHQEFASRGLNFFGMGVSGGEAGARHGPAMMPGGPRDAYERLKPMLDSIAAKVDGEPCVDYVGTGSAGHYVKMVHNGIEYGLMQIWAEIYDLLHRGLGLPAGRLADVFDRWQQGELESFLLGITSKIFRKIDDVTKKPLVDVILDVARQKGTGKWASLEGFGLQVPIPTIDQAVNLRDLSAMETERKRAREVLGGPLGKIAGDANQRIEQIRLAAYGAILITYAQGFALLHKASQSYKYELHLGNIAKIWRGGCIIRARMLEAFRQAFGREETLPNLLLDPGIAQDLKRWEPAFREILGEALKTGIPTPAMLSALSYFDSLRAGRLPLNLVQAQRDFFGAHTYERTDMPGTFHTQWE